jgi:hypothetical protein
MGKTFVFGLVKIREKDNGKDRLKGESPYKILHPKTIQILRDVYKLFRKPTIYCKRVLNYTQLLRGEIIG